MARTYGDIRAEFYLAFEELAKACEPFLGHDQTFRDWLITVFSRYGVREMRTILAAWPVLAHSEFALSKDSDLLPKFPAVLLSLKRIEALSKELEEARREGLTVPA
jgi:hypothetical protein